jgi:hypothetical protein
MAGDTEYLIISLVGRQKPVPEFGHAMAIHSHGKKGVSGLTVVGPWKQRKSFALTWLSNQAYLCFFLLLLISFVTYFITICLCAVSLIIITLPHTPPV